MKKKEKIILSLILMVTGSVVNLFFTAALHRLLTRQNATLTFLPFGQSISGLFTERQQMLLFLSFEGFLVLCGILFFLQNSRPYQSTLIRVAGEICTPAPVGQYQHGSSRWLRPDERGKVFQAQVIDPHNKVIRMLLDTGYDDLPFMGDKDGAEELKERKQEKAVEQEEFIEDFPSEHTNIPNGEEDDSFENVKYEIPVTPPATGEQDEQDGQEKPIKEGQGASNLSNPGGNDPLKLFGKGGIVVGMEKSGGKETLYMVGEDTHTLTIGATRSGKTRCLVIQSICSIALAGESLVVSDPKAELFHYTSGYLKKLKYEVVCIDFKNPEKSSRYNLLQPVIDAVNEGEMERAEMYAWDITNILVGDNTSNEKIWENGEKSTIAAAILCVVVDNRKRPEYQNLTNVYWFIAEMSKTVGNTTPMKEYLKKLPPKHPARALLSIAEVAPSRTKGSFDTSALTTEASR